jgi:hypothetical protein
MLKGSSSSKQWPSCPKKNAALNNDEVWIQINHSPSKWYIFLLEKKIKLKFFIKNTSLNL